MRVVIIGGSGHVGTYLVPRLVEAGYEVINITRGRSKPYLPHAAWGQVQQVVIDRDTAENDGSFGAQIAALAPQIVVDMVCFTEPSARHLVNALRGKVQHFLHCGTLWVHGYPVQQPTTEDAPRKPFPKYELTVTDVDPYLLTDYGVQKAAVEAYLLDEARRSGFPVTILHPGHIVGPGHKPVTPQGNDNPEVFAKLASGDELLLPNIGMETVHHVHGDDVAQLFQLAIQQWSASVGEAFHVASPNALTLRGYAESVASWFGKAATLRFVSWDDFCRLVPEHDWSMTWDHIAHSPNASIAKAQRLLGYQPRYTSLQAVYESVFWMIDHGLVKV
jgi:nucleoside-diphosphate-sugar epimerase